MDEIFVDAPHVIFVTGTGTDVGKTYATGWLAKRMTQAGRKVITQKLIQTGCRDRSEDIEAHRRIMGIPLQPRDLDHTTDPIILSYPASPHLAAHIDGVELDYDVAARCTERLASEYDCVLVEGAGGLMVPLKEDFMTLDYIVQHNLPTAAVVNGQLGSINHALLTLQALQRGGATLWAVVYNTYFDTDKIISDETRKYLREYVSHHHPAAHYIVMD